MRAAFAILLFATVSRAALANVGVFSGYGHSLELASTDQIKMVREDVTIIPGRGQFQFDGGIPGMDRVEYDCKFELKNLTDKPTKVQVGFPLNAEFLKPSNIHDQKVEDLVSKYRFIVQEGPHIHSLRFSPGDREKKLKNLFLWDLEFKGGETKNVRVSYCMPISMTLATSRKDQSREPSTQEWQRPFERCFLEFFGYVTETGQSWSGPIDEATFRVHTNGFDAYILNRPMMEGVTDEIRDEYLKGMPIWRPVVCRVMEPAGWKMTEKGYWELRFENYKAEENLVFQYFLLSIPQTVEDARRMIEQGSLDVNQRKDLADVIREFNGTKTQNKRIKEFISTQVWHGRTPLRNIPVKVIAAIETYGDNKTEQSNR